MPDAIHQGVKTIVSVHGYKGDEHQIRALLPCYEHHKLPIVILTPTDSRIPEMGPHICRFGGLREYVGAKSLARQLEHWKILLEYDATHYLCNDSDSFCVSAQLPQYIYDEDVLWSNEVSDMFHVRPATYTLPRLAFQPPYFFSRGILERLIAAAPLVVFEPQTPFIDWYFMAVAHAGGIPHKNFRDGISCGTADSSIHPTAKDGGLGLRAMTNAVQNHGAIFLHAVKSAQVRRQMEFVRKLYVRNHP
jgi:hypothetical protein